jgi:hypothetical protein
MVPQNAALPNRNAQSVPFGMERLADMPILLTGGV